MNELKTLQEENIKGILKEICYPEELPNGIELANLITAMQHCFTLGMMKGVEESSNHFRTEIDKLYVFGTSTAVGGLYTDEKMRGDNVEVASWIKKEDVLAIELPDYKLKQELK